MIKIKDIIIDESEPKGYSGFAKYDPQTDSYDLKLPSPKGFSSVGSKSQDSSTLVITMNIVGPVDPDPGPVRSGDDKPPLYTGYKVELDKTYEELVQLVPNSSKIVLRIMVGSEGIYQEYLVTNYVMSEQGLHSITSYSYVGSIRTDLALIDLSSNDPTLSMSTYLISDGSLSMAGTVTVPTTTLVEEFINSKVPENIQEISTEVDELQQEVGTVNTTINNINSNIETINTNIDNVEADINTANTNISTINDNISTINNEIDQVEAQINTITGNISTINSNITSLQNSKLSYLALQVGNSDEIKQANLQVLNTVSGAFFTQLGSDYGVGTYQTGTGGFIHVITAYSDDYYQISSIGEITKDNNYISPNEPYTIELESNQIGVALDDTIANKVFNAGQLIVTESTGTVTYIRTPDSTSSNVYFTNSKKDGSLTILTYTVSSETITSSTISPGGSSSSGYYTIDAQLITASSNDSTSIDTWAGGINNLINAVTTGTPVTAIAEGLGVGGGYIFILMAVYTPSGNFDDPSTIQLISLNVGQTTGYTNTVINITGTTYTSTVSNI